MRRATAVVLLVLLTGVSGHAQKVSDVRGTRHNLSVTGPGTVKAVSETQVCVFCHTPHGATSADDSGVGVRAPLWNRRIPAGATYTPYASASLDANVIQGQLDQPGGSSKLCLSCHDGTLALGSVNVLGGQSGASIELLGTGTGGVMPPGEGTASGFTRNLGVDLRNDHPISVTYTEALARRDGELRLLDLNQRWPPGSGEVIGVRAPGFKPKFPLEPTGAANQGQVQCAACHDAHVRDADPAKGNQKFLRGERFQEASPSVAGFNAATDIVCLACHDKNLDVGAWANSAHAHPLVANETYNAGAAALRDFPTGLPVWKASCMNCHDTHTVQGARRLTREGTDSTATPKQGGNPALEQTCYQCHTVAAKTALNASAEVPNIESDFALPRRMPITTAEQAATSEPHDIGGNFNDIGFVDCSTTTNKCGADFLESRQALRSRHAECTDCHNPHRVIRNRSLVGNAASPDPAGTHRHEDATGYTHTNIASGVLRGAWGVEPIYGSASFQDLPSGYLVKRGDPGASLDVNVAAPYVTREYQICLKCHSDYGYDDNNAYPTGNRPNLGYLGGTPSGTNNLTQYTNQAKEFQAPIGHRGQTTTTDSGAGSNFSTNNHRSWHPVIDSTGRTGAIRGNGTDISARWLLPWRNAVGTQTMYCSDCHGSNVTSGTSVIPDGGENGNPWGPHGSGSDFLLKGAWNASTGTGQQSSGLCFKCHDYNAYAARGRLRTGFFVPDRGEDGHTIHFERIGRMRCTWCHAAVPHGWKNKALLVNLNDVGPEAGQPGNIEWRMGADSHAFNQQPYYLNAKLKVRTFATSGNWAETNCGSRGGATFGTNPNNTQIGRDWMKAVCSNPP